jgi:hypothetical protein
MRGWLVSPVIGDGTEDDPFRPAVADRKGVEGDRLEFVIDVERSDVALVGYDVADDSNMPNGERLLGEADLDRASDKVPQAAQLRALAARMKVGQAGNGRDVLRRIGQKISPTFDERLHLGSGKAPPTGSFVSDTFTEAAETLLNEHVGETGATWTVHPSNTGEAKVQQKNGGSYLRSTKAAGTTAIYYASGVPASADYNVAAERWRQNGLAIAGRMSTTALTLYFAGRASPERYVLSKIVAGSITTLASYSIASAEQYDALVLKLTDAEKVLYLNGEAVITSTDNVIAAAGRVGVYGGVNSVSADKGIDNLIATNAVETPTSRSRRRMLV